VPHPLWKQIVPDLSDPQQALLDRFVALLIEWNQRLNLTRIIDPADAQVRHIADALTLVPMIGAGVKTVADVGTGGGVPGVPIAIARPGVRVTLIDSTRKKLDAVADIVRQLGLPNVEVLHARIEAVPQKFDLITARAVADFDTLLGWCDPLMHGRSTLLALKGPRAAEEIAAVAPGRKRRFEWTTSAVDVPELSGHVVIRARKREGGRP
jgi:16S rRNA (guanine527-N7)-methyltransferase